MPGQLPAMCYSQLPARYVTINNELNMHDVFCQLDSIPGLDDAVLQSKATSVDAENAQNSNAASVSQPQESLKVPEVENILFVKDDPR